MKKLGQRNYLLISEAVKCCGTFDPNEILPMFEERLYVDQYNEVVDFLTWVHESGKTFGSGNYEQVFAEYKATGRKVEKLVLPSLDQVTPVVINLGV